MLAHFEMHPSLKPGNLFLKFFLGAVLLLVASLSYAQTIVIKNNTVINKHVTYSNVTLDLSQGEFTIAKGGLLTIENSIVNVTISPTNPFFAYLTSGCLVLTNSTVNVAVSGLTPNPASQAMYQLIAVDQGLVKLNKNTITIDTPFTVGFLKTNPAYTTSGFNISDNTISYFNGGIYLMNSNTAEINHNIFSNISFSSIFNTGNLSNFKDNLFSFPGNLAYGDAIDIVNSDGLTISGNIIASSAGYGILIIGGQNLFISKNKISDGLSYGIYIEAPSLAAVKKNKFLAQLKPQYKPKLTPNTDITITENYIALNRYGIAGDSLSNLTVQNNTFIQRFTDSATRQFWTNNDVLFSAATGITWVDNLYKEAFTQDNEGDNSLSLQFVTFPAHGGVSL